MGSIFFLLLAFALALEMAPCLAPRFDLTPLF